MANSRPILDAIGDRPHEKRQADPEPWDVPIPLGDEIAVPTFPLACLPQWLHDWVKAEAHATQTPTDLAALLALATAGAALAKKYRVCIRHGWTEPTNLYVVVGLLPGERKSVVFRDVMAPVESHEQNEQERMAPAIATANSEYRMLGKRLENAERDAAKAESVVEREQLQAAAKHLAQQLTAFDLPQEPRLICEDVTQEKLQQLLAAQGGRMLLAGAEGTVFEIINGRYAEKVNFDVFTKAHSGDDIRDDRVGRTGAHIKQPALSMALAVQPDVIRGLAENATLKARGFLARFFYAVPVSLVGAHSVAPDPVPSGVSCEFNDNMLALWRLTGTVDGTGKPAPRWLTFSTDADQAMRVFAQWLEPQMGKDGDLSFLAGWAEKLAGAVARIAGILHVAGAVGSREEPSSTIECATVDAAIRLAKDYLLPHAQAAFGLMGMDDRLEDAKRVVKWIKNPKNHHVVDPTKKNDHSVNTVNCVNGVAILSQRLVHSSILGSKWKPEEVEKVITVLVNYGYLRPVAPVSYTGPGRKSSPKFEVNPAIFPFPYAGSDSHNSQNSQNGTPPVPNFAGRPLSDDEIAHGIFDGRGIQRDAKTCRSLACQRPACVAARNGHHKVGKGSNGQ